MAPRTQTDAGSKKIATHPPVAEMVKSAITNLKDRKGSSLAAIKKYIDSNYEGIDMVKIAPFIRRFLKKAVEDGALVIPKGHPGSYKPGPELKNASKPKTEGQSKKTAVRKAVPKKSASKKGQRAALKKTPAPRKRVKKSKTPKRPSAQKALFQTPQPGKPAAKGKKRTLMDGIVGL